MNKVLLTLSIMVLSGSLLAQESPRLQKPRAYRSSRGQRSRWRAGSPLSGGRQTIPVARLCIMESCTMATDPKDLSQTAENPLRLNPYHSSTVFRVHLYNLKPRTRPTTRWTRWSPTAGATG